MKIPPPCLWAICASAQPVSEWKCVSWMVRKYLLCFRLFPQPLVLSLSAWKSAWLFVLPLPVFIYIDTCIPCVLYTHIYAQSQLSQPFLMGEMLQSLNLVALCWTLLSLQGSPELDTSLQCGLTSGEQRGRILLFPAASALPNAAQGLFGHLYGKVTLLVYVWCGVY